MLNNCPDQANRRIRAGRRTAPGLPRISGHLHQKWGLPPPARSFTGYLPRILCQRAVSLKSRTRTICTWTGLSRDRVRRLAGSTSPPRGGESRVRHRGRSPRQTSYFFRSPQICAHANVRASYFDSRNIGAGQGFALSYCSSGWFGRFPSGEDGRCPSGRLLACASGDELCPIRVRALTDDERPVFMHKSCFKKQFNR